MRRTRDGHLKTVIQKNVNGTRTYIRRVIVRVIIKVDSGVGTAIILVCIATEVVIKTIGVCISQ